MRVLFLGTTGIKKTDTLEQIADIALKEKFKLTNGLSHSDADRYVKIYDIDNRIKSKLGSGYSSFMDGKVRESLKDVWKKEAEEILQEIETRKPKHVFLSAHGVYYRYNNYFSLIDMGLLATFHPDIIITLIDDIYDVSERVTKKELEYKTNSSCTLSEALGWRTIEIFMGDLIAENLFINPSSVGIANTTIKDLPVEVKKFFQRNIPHFVIAVKHNPRMLYRLLFERNRLVMYASFPITSTRTDPQKIDEINEFKKRLENEHTVLDPATIDEITLRKKSDISENDYEMMKTKKVIVKENEDFVMLKRLHGNYSRSTDYPTFLEPHSLIPLSDAILKQVEKRDYRMVSQSQCVVAYRPFWGARADPSGGVDAELNYANLLKKGIFAFHPKEDGDPVTLFRGVDTAIKFSILDELLEQLEKEQEIHKKSRNGLPDTWEEN